jgi:hypothetical protein
MSLFRPASKTKSRLRLALIGPSGSGKTFSALTLASELATHMRAQGGSGRVAVVDTERGSASKYADRFSFEVVELAQCDPRNYIEVIEAAEAERFDVLVIDSLSHAWSGKGGSLELVDKAAKQSKSNNTFMAWRNVTPLHNALVDAIIGSGCHVIATMRSKVDYVMEADPNTGKLTPKKVGMAPIQREGMDYEFDVVGDMDLDHNLLITKTRCERLDGEVINRPGKSFARTLIDWLSDGAPAASAGPATGSASPPAMPLGGLPREIGDRIRDLVALTGTTDHQLRGALARRGVSEIDNLSEDDARTLIAGLENNLRAIQAAQGGEQAQEADTNEQEETAPAETAADRIGNELVDQLVSQSNGRASVEADPPIPFLSEADSITDSESPASPTPSTDDFTIGATERAEPREPAKPKRKPKADPQPA